jgi:hypothetical protein
MRRSTAAPKSVVPRHTLAEQDESADAQDADSSIRVPSARAPTRDRVLEARDREQPDDRGGHPQAEERRTQGRAGSIRRQGEPDRVEPGEGRKLTEERDGRGGLKHVDRDRQPEEEREGSRTHLVVSGTGQEAELRDAILGMDGIRDDPRRAFLKRRRSGGRMRRPSRRLSPGTGTAVA